MLGTKWNNVAKVSDIWENVRDIYEETGCHNLKGFPRNSLYKPIYMIQPEFN